MELIEATKRGDVHGVLILLESGVDVNIKNGRGLIPLHLACWNGYPEIVKILLKAGANVDTQDGEGETPLHIASWWGYAKIIYALLEAGTNVEIRNNEGQTPKDRAANEAILKIFEEYSFDIKEPGCE